MTRKSAAPAKRIAASDRGFITYFVAEPSAGINIRFGGPEPRITLRIPRRTGSGDQTIVRAFSVLPDGDIRNKSGDAHGMKVLAGWKPRAGALEAPGQDHRFFGSLFTVGFDSPVDFWGCVSLNQTWIFVRSHPLSHREFDCDLCPGAVLFEARAVFGPIQGLFRQGNRVCKWEPGRFRNES